MSVAAYAVAGGDYNILESFLDHNTQWLIFDQNLELKGKGAIEYYCKDHYDYFVCATKYHEEHGLVTQGQNVAIYGVARYIRDAELLKCFHFCHCLEFNIDGILSRICTFSIACSFT